MADADWRGKGSCSRVRVPQILPTGSQAATQKNATCNSEGEALHLRTSHSHMKKVSKALLVTLAVLVTALMWSGVSVRDVLTAIGF
jgi:hypothetical protein